MRQLFLLLALLSSCSRAAAGIRLKRRRPRNDESYGGGPVNLSVRPKPWRSITIVQFRVKPPGQKPLAWRNGKPYGAENKIGKKWSIISNLPSSSPGTWIWRVRVVNASGQKKRSNWRKLRVTAPLNEFSTYRPSDLPTALPTNPPNT